MQAYRNNLLLRMIKGRETTESGLVLPNGGYDTKNISEVISCGPDVAVKLEPGTRVVFSKGQTFTFNSVEYIVCSEVDICAVIS